MKIIISLILILSTISNCFANISNQYINFEIYNDEKCQKPNPTYGFGYSFATSTCLTLNFMQNFLFKYENNKIQWSTYNNNWSNMICNIESQVGTSPTFSNGECIPFSNITQFNSYQEPTEKIYYKISITPNPVIPKDVIAQSFMGEKCSLSENIVASQYYISESLFNTYGNQSYFFFCNSTDSPLTKQCKQNGNCETYSVGEHCVRDTAFYNGSSTEETSSKAGSSYSVGDSSNSGCSSGSGGSCSSGSLSGDSSQTGSVSGSGSSSISGSSQERHIIKINGGNGYNKESTKKQSDETLRRHYYISFYCT